MTTPENRNDDRRRPRAEIADASAAVGGFVAELQHAIDTADAVRFNRSFADDALWGSPFGAVVEGYDEIHGIHAAMFDAASRRGGVGSGGSDYVVEHARLLADDVAVAYVRRVRRPAAGDHGDRRPASGRADTFDELALFVLVRRDGTWWLAAGLHTPDRRDVYSDRNEDDRVGVPVDDA